MITHLNHTIAARVLLPVLLGVLLPASCRPAYIAPPVSPELVRDTHEPPARLERGLYIYRENCAKCHAFENPADYGEDKLTHQIIPAMAKKAKLTTDDEQAVLVYLLAARKLSAK